MKNLVYYLLSTIIYFTVPTFLLSEGWSDFNIFIFATSYVFLWLPAWVSLRSWLNKLGEKQEKTCLVKIKKAAFWGQARALINDDGAIEKLTVDVTSWRIVLNDHDNENKFVETFQDTADYKQGDLVTLTFSYGIFNSKIIVHKIEPIAKINQNTESMTCS